MTDAAAQPAFIPLCVPQMYGNEWAYIRECLDTNWVSSVGSFVNRFEQAVAERIGGVHAVAMVNGTAALHIALLLAGVQPDDEVLVSTLTFVASANVIRYVGAWPVFVDAEPAYWQMDQAKVSDFLEHRCRWRAGALWNTSTGRRIRAIMPVHVLGHPVDIAPIKALAQQYDLALIEDATESLGAGSRGSAVGQFGDVACFSFNGNKLLTTGGGGMLVTANEAWARQAAYLTTQAKDDPVEYIHTAVGYNYRLTNLQAAMGVAQMEHLDKAIAAKRRIAATYTAALADVPGITPMREATWAQSVFWMYTVLVDDRFGPSARQLLAALSAAQIQTRPLWQPLHLSPAHRGSPATDCSVAERLFQQALSLPCSVGLTAGQQQRVIDAVHAMGGTNAWTH